MQNSDGGGGGFLMDTAALIKVARDLSTEAHDMDSIGNALPGSSDFGLAGSVAHAMMAAFCEAGARLSMECSTIGEALDQSVNWANAQDSAAAQQFLMTGAVGE